MIRYGNIINGIGSIALAIILAACSDEIPQGGTEGKGDSFLKIEHAALSNPPVTRVTAGTELTDPNDKIGVFLKEGNGYEAVDNYCFTYGSPAWTSDKKILLTDREATLAAVYPYSAGTSQPALISCQRYSTAGDLCALAFKATSATGSQTIALQHVYARIRFNFSVPQGGYDEQGKLTALKLENSGFISSARYDLFTAALTPLPGSNILINGLDTDIKGSTEEDRRADCLVVPATSLSGDIGFSVTLDGNVLTGHFTSVQLCGAAGKLEAGKQYDVNVKVVTKSSLSVTSVETTDWSETTVEGDYTPAPLNLSASVLSLVKTRAEETTTPVDAENSMIGVFVGSANGYEPRYNIPYLYKGGKWYTDQPIFAGSNNITLYAAYPYTAAVFQPGTTLTTLTAAHYEGTKDFCYATTGGADINNLNPSPSFTLQRAYARLALQIRRSDYPGACNVTQIDLNGGDGSFYNTRTLDISTGTHIGESSSDGLSLSVSITVNQEPAGDSSTDILLPPQNLAAGLRLTLTVDGAKLTTTVPPAKLAALQSGNFYKIKLLMADNSIGIDGAVEFDEWKPALQTIDAQFIMPDGVRVTDWREQVAATFEAGLLENGVTGTDWRELPVTGGDLKLDK